MIQTQTIPLEGKCNISSGAKNNHYPVWCSDQEEFREPVFCWGHNSKSLILNYHSSTLIISSSQEYPSKKM